MLADAFWLDHIGNWYEAGKYDLSKAELCLRDVVDADTFPLLWSGWLSFFTELYFSCKCLITVMYTLAYPFKTLQQKI